MKINLYYSVIQIARPNSMPNNVAAKLNLAGRAVLAFAGIEAFAQPAGPPLAFDVASVKVTANPRARGFGYFTKYSPDTLTIRDISMWMCVRLAYGVENFRIAGPDSTQNPPFYEIVAKAATPVPESQLRLMLRKLLADRFHLTLHWEKKEMSVTALLIAKSGSKMRPATGAFNPERGDDAHMQNLGYDNDVHIQRSAGANGNIRFTFTNASMALFATWLESSSSVFIYDKAPIVDLTELRGRFDWAVDSSLVHPPGGGDGAGTTIVADGNTGGALLDHYKPILESELGLTLERRKAMVDILVIDHVDKEPTPKLMKFVAHALLRAVSRLISTPVFVKPPRRRQEIRRDTQE